MHITVALGNDGIEEELPKLKVQNTKYLFRCYNETGELSHNYTKPTTWTAGHKAYSLTCMCAYATWSKVYGHLNITPTCDS